MFRAFFDETQSHQGELVSGVASCVFDDKGYEAFVNGWAPRIEEFGSFSLTDLYFGNKPFDRCGEQERITLWMELGNLIRRTRIASSISFITQQDFADYKKAQPEVEAFVGNPYAFCLLHCAFIVAEFAKSKGVDSILYSFESGGPKWKEASALLQRASEQRKVAEYLRMKGFAFVEKKIEPALHSADYLAWGWQRTYAKNLDKWHETFEIVRSDKEHPLYITRLREGHISSQMMFNLFYGLDSHPSWSGSK